MISLNKLKNIDTPARYIGGEARQVIKNANVVKNRVCTVVPAMYEMGMMDFDLKSIYYVLNNRTDTWCERAFAPMPDFEALLRQENEKLYTLESKTPLKDMDVIIFVLSSELMFTNMLNILNLAGVPILKDRRREGFPLIIATGSGINNPKPLEKFVDLFVIGECSYVINDVISGLVKGNKEETFKNIIDITGVYIPNVTEAPVYMACEEDIDAEIVPKTVVSPSVRTMFDKTIVMLTKGCSKNCMMCAHKYAYGAVQQMSPDKAVLKAKHLINATGNTDVCLMTNCYGDYSGFPEVIYKLKDIDRPKIKELSFMEVKLTKDNLWLLKYMENKEEYPSVIVGGGTFDLRKKIGIEITDEDVLFVAKKVFEAGFNKIRLKYILGIPGETYEDFPKMLDMANKICKVYKEVYSKSPDKYIVELNIYNFSPKPHTPSCWCPVNSAENFELKKRYLMEKNKNENVIIVAADGRQTVIETLLARGDEKVSDVIYEAWKQGAKNDMIGPMFSYDSWQVALNKTGVDIKKYLEEINEKVLLPWDNIYLKTKKEDLRREYLKHFKGV